MGCNCNIQENGLNKCSLCSIVILILVLLKFGANDCEDKCVSPKIDNSVLFIIAIFFLSCKC